MQQECSIPPVFCNVLLYTTSVGIALRTVWVMFWQPVRARIISLSGRSSVWLRWSEVCKGAHGSGDNPHKVLHRELVSYVGILFTSWKVTGTSIYGKIKNSLPSSWVFGERNFQIILDTYTLWKEGFKRNLKYLTSIKKAPTIHISKVLEEPDLIFQTTALWRTHDKVLSVLETFLESDNGFYLEDTSEWFKVGFFFLRE